MLLSGCGKEGDEYIDLAKNHKGSGYKLTTYEHVIENLEKGKSSWEYQGVSNDMHVVLYSGNLKMNDEIEAVKIYIGIAERNDDYITVPLSMVRVETGEELGGALEVYMYSNYGSVFGICVIAIVTLIIFGSLVGKIGFPRSFVSFFIYLMVSGAPIYLVLYLLSIFFNFPLPWAY